MQKNSASTQSSTEILKQAIQFIGQHNVTAVPINYTVSYEYCRGEHILLRQAIDHAIANKQAITNDQYLVHADRNEANETTNNRQSTGNASLQDRLATVTIEAVTDPLTGLYNRKGLSMAINEALLSAQQSQNYPCLLLLDIDYFKKINDNFGHLLGDKAIKILADTLKKQIKGKDTAARYGGEEFAILLLETGLQNAWKVAENIRYIIENMKITRTNDHEELFRMTISMGIARYQADQSINDFIEHADNALYQSKNTGRNRVTIFEEKG